MHLRQKPIRTVWGIFSEYFLLKMLWRKRLAVFYLRYQRGNGLINIFKDWLMIVGVGSVITGQKLDWPIYLFVLLGAFWVFICYTSGYLDEKFGFWKAQEGYYSGEINPFIKNLGEKVDDIHKQVNGRDYKIHY